MIELAKETILGAMLTELAKLTGISAVNLIAQYERLFERYVDCTKLRILLETSEPAENWHIIQQAKELSLGKKQMEANQARPLCSVFSNMSLDGSYPEKMYYKPGELTVDNVFPCPLQMLKQYDVQGIAEAFCGELESMLYTSPKDFDSFLIVVDTLLRKYFWSIPASGELDEDVSAYDYIKTAMAIASALVKCEKKDTPFMLVAGHFSGIQKYIFSVSKVGTGGVTKRLRARSFYVNAMVSALAHAIVHRFEVPMVNILMLTGGKFYILLPNTEDAEAHLCNIEKQTSEFLHEKFKGNLSFELIWEEGADDSLRNYDSTVTRLSNKIEQKKNRLLKSVLVQNGKWNTEKFVVYQDLYHKSMCSACKSALVEEGKEMCHNCEVDTEIGGKLPKIKMFSFSKNKGQYQLVDGYYLNLDVKCGKEENYLYMKLNHACINDMYDKPVTAYYAVNHVPTKNNGERLEVKTFTEIANAAKGNKKLGILKADVDTLGFLFAEGLRKENLEPVSISRVNTLSRMLDMFFGGYLCDLIKSRYKNVYCVFSGGDDLFFIGPWNEMPVLALEINQKFHEYTGGNPCMTVSAAICVAEGGGHISTLAEFCEQKLTQVKKQANQIMTPGKMGRNGVYFLGQIMTWEDLKEQVNRGKWFAQLVRIVGTGFFRRLLKYNQMYQTYLESGEAENLMCLPLLSNDMRRNYKTLNKNEEFKEYCNNLYKRISNYRKIDREFYYTEISVKYALGLTKEERING